MISFPKLLPCAHCGSTDVRLFRRIENNTVYWNVQCVDCGIMTESYPEDCIEQVDEQSAISKAMDEAIECAVYSWNKRVQIDNVSKFYDDKLSWICNSIENMSNDDIVTVSKKATDILVNKANKLIDEISKAMGDNDG